MNLQHATISYSVPLFIDFPWVGYLQHFSYVNAQKAQYSASWYIDRDAFRYAYKGRSN